MQFDKIVFDNLQGLVRTAVVGVCAYVAVVLLVRLSGSRTLSKMSAFDFVVTVALGSTLATILLSKDVALAEGVLALALLIGLQYAVAWLSRRFRWFRELVDGTPKLLFYQGRYLEDMMRSARVTRDDVLAAMRSGGQQSAEGVQAVVLETDGKFSVITTHADGASTLRNVTGAKDRHASVAEH